MFNARFFFKQRLISWEPQVVHNGSLRQVIVIDAIFL